MPELRAIDVKIDKEIAEIIERQTKDVKDFRPTNHEDEVRLDVLNWVKRNS